MALTDLDDPRFPSQLSPGLHVGVVSTYPPRACGIGTFSADLRASLLGTVNIQRVEVAAVVSDGDEAGDPEVIATMREGVRSDFATAGRLLSGRNIDVVIIEHEYGIFGGRDGDAILALAAELTMPYMVTLHTVLSEPSPSQAEVVRELTRRAALVTVFTSTARRLVAAQQLAAADKVRVVPHGAPELLTQVARQRRAALPAASNPGWGDYGESRFVLSSFGLISPGKGLEVAIEALPAVIECHPDVLLVIAGRTHPEVAKRDGERYRLRLEQLVRSLRLEAHVHFDDRFLSIEELAGLLAITDVYLTPYRSRDQIVSGALTFAIAAGRPVISTPYLYAADLLSSGAGVLVPFDDPGALAAAIRDLIENPVLLAEVCAEARRVGADLAWPAIAQSTAELLQEAVAPRAPPVPHAADGLRCPPLRTDHLLQLVDDVGIVQHAYGAVPNRSTGYCVDDMARLAQVAQQLCRRGDDPRWAALVTRALAFLEHASEGPVRGAGLRNFMGYDRRWLDEPHPGDHVGRAIWALGEILAEPPPAAVAEPAVALFHRLLCGFDDDDPFVRTAAYTVLGLSAAGPDSLGDPARKLLERFVDLLVTGYRRNATAQWRWFEDRLTYDNGRLPQALIVASRHLDDPAVLEIGLTALDWYGQQCGLQRDFVHLPGNQGRDRHQPAPGDGDEQPLDAAALVEAELDALEATGDSCHASRARRAFGWFLGRNHLGCSVYDPVTGGCRDGLSATGLNPNQGAESTLAFFHARLRLETDGLPTTGRQPRSWSRTAA